jgi:hypothetical protein
MNDEQFPSAFAQEQAISRAGWESYVSGVFTASISLLTTLITEAVRTSETWSTSTNYMAQYPRRLSSAMMILKMYWCRLVIYAGRIIEEDNLVG